ncbi:MAG TPA: long-chain-acyl-CoA synthetase [Polyangiaceae bacterium]|nr:long-chain-acyl-CoA synthetase [Polyangiaceae bacterium]
MRAPKVEDIGAAASVLAGGARACKDLLGMVALDRASPALPLRFQEIARATPDRPFLLHRDHRVTYGRANEIVNAHALAYRGLGLRRGDVVALLMENRPEYYWHFLGLAKLGVVVALVNTHAKASALAHAIRIANPRRIVVGSELWASLGPLRVTLAEMAPGAVDVDVDPDSPDAAAQAGGLPVWQERLPPPTLRDPPETSLLVLDDVCAYMYTSGTTGAPKAALVKHRRIGLAANLWAGLVWRCRPGDVVYVPLPLYHANGMILGTGSAIAAGATIALARKFSARGFWNDCRRYGATCSLYIGELCRYLMNAPPTAGDRDHSVRVFSGNGLRPDIWEAFQRRFGIPRVVEFYASTEGNVLTINFGNVTGSVGKLPPGRVLARWDEEAQRFSRDARGHLIKCKPGEPGILLGKIDGLIAFDGYRDEKATEGKIVRDAFAPGDAWFNTGDLLRQNWKRDLFFVDRLGDTFRWKGENVSTFEVQEQLSTWSGVDEVNVYGVQVSGTEGRAGMAALVLRGEGAFDAHAFKRHIDAILPPYARPLFVRVQRKMQTTGTFKLQKADLQREGFDPAAVGDPLYFRHPRTDEYVLLDQLVYAEIAGGSLRL